LTFTPSGFEDNLSQLGNKLDVIPQRLWDYVNSANIVEILSPVTGILDTLERIGPKIIQEGENFVTEVGDFLAELFTFPFEMWDASNKWEGIATTLTSVESDLNGQLQEYSQEWTGIAAGKYNYDVNKQPGAVGSLASVAAALGSFCESVANQTLYFLLDLISYANDVYQSPDTLDPGIVLNTIVDASANAAKAYTRLHTGTDLFRTNLQNAVKLAAGQLPFGNWPNAAS
jgi:uncharacterized protein YukE